MMATDQNGQQRLARLRTEGFHAASPFSSTDPIGLRTWHEADAQWVLGVVDTVIEILEDANGEWCMDEHAVVKALRRATSGTTEQPA